MVVRIQILFMLAILGAGFGAGAQTDETTDGGELYVVATAHLDTQWRWTIQTTIGEYLWNTLQENFALLEKYPDYVFSFEGSFRYQLMKEYYPAEYERLRRYIDQGRWRLAGSWIDAVDVNVPSPEALIRHALIANGFYRREFGKTSCDIFLPDCFGFGYALPSVAAHTGLLGFSTQKLTWGSSVGIPFDIGLWEGVDGSTVIAAVNPEAYVSRIRHDLSADSTWVETVARQGEQSGVFAGFKYYGTGDVGGGPTDESVSWLQKSLVGKGPLNVLSTGSDQLMRDLTPEQQSGLPRYNGELLMTSHGVGCYTSQAAMKRWNRQNEVLADAAERAAVVADWIGAIDYPGETLTTAWTRFLWHGFHDDLTGTSIPEAYNFSWNDELLSLNQFASVVTDAVGGVSRALDTRVKGVPLVVYNPLAYDREDLVEATVVFPKGKPRAIRVYGPDGQEVPAQAKIPDNGKDECTVVFLAYVPATGFAVYDVRPGKKPCQLETGLSASSEQASLENQRYRVQFDADGFLSSIHDKSADRELLAEPFSLQFLDNEPERWAAWEIDYDDLMAEPRSQTGTLASWYEVEQGPARVSFCSSIQCEASMITQRVSLGSGDARDRIEIEMEIDWQTPGTLLKAAFPLAITAEEATYDLGLGTIARKTSTPELYEVPAQRWVDLSSADQQYGVSILSDCRYGWDKPDDHTLRLSLVHTPSVNDNWRWVNDQRSQDLGLHQLKVALYGHTGDWRNGVARQADRMVQPLLAFQVPEHDGALGREFSFLHVESEPGTDGTVSKAADPPAVAVRAIKLADQGREIVVRLQEMAGRSSGALRIVFARPVIAARELDGAEQPLGEAELAAGCLRTELNPYQPRTFAVTLDVAPVALTPPTAQSLNLPYNFDGISRDDDPTDGDFDGAGHTLAGELLPDEFTREGIPFRTGPQQPSWANVLACQGQRLTLPVGDHDRLYVLAAATGGGTSGSFVIDEHVTDLWIQDYAEPVGQWNNRVIGGMVYHEPHQIAAGYINRAEAAWVGTHRHGPDGENEPYVFTHFFKHRIDLPPKATELILPDNPAIKILAATVAQNENDTARPAVDLYDRYDFTSVSIQSNRRAFLDSIEVAIHSPNPRAVIRYTLDGSDPVETSPVYSKPVTLTENTTVSARAFAPGMLWHAPAVASFTALTARAPVTEAVTSPGLVCEYFTGAWNELPDFASLESGRTDISDQVRIPDHAAEEDIGLVFNGYLWVHERGFYRLHLSSDDGSALYLGDEKVIDNDGLHGSTDIVASLALDPGLFPIRIEYFQHLGGRDLKLEWEGPGIELQSVPASALCHTPGQP